MIHLPDNSNDNGNSNDDDEDPLNCSKDGQRLDSSTSNILSNKTTNTRSRSAYSLDLGRRPSNSLKKSHSKFDCLSRLARQSSSSSCSINSLNGEPEDLLISNKKTPSDNKKTLSMSISQSQSLKKFLRSMFFQFYYVI